MRSFITLYPNASAWRVSGTNCASEFSVNLSHRPINSTFKSRKCTERERKNRGELRRSTEGNVLPLSNGITRIVPIYSNRLNTSSIAREYRGNPSKTFLERVRPILRVRWLHPSLPCEFVCQPENGFLPSIRDANRAED